MFALALATTAAHANALVAQSAADSRSAAEVRALFVEFNAAWERRDRAFVDRFYAHDTGGVFFFERRQLRGWPKVDSLYAAMFTNAARGRVESRFEVLDVRARGPVAWLAATFRLAVIDAAGDTTVDEGRQSLVFERRTMGWVVVHRHTSFQAPPGPQRRVALHTTPGPLWSPLDDTTGGPDARAIRMARERSNLAIAAHDTAGVGSILADNVVVVTSASVHQIGRDVNLTSFAAQFRARPNVVYRRTPSEISLFAPWAMASETGTWAGSWTEPDGKVRIGGRYSAKWRRVNGQWLVESETYVPDRCTGSAFCTRQPAP